MFVCVWSCMLRALVTLSYLNDILSHTWSPALLSPFLVDKDSDDTNAKGVLRRHLAGHPVSNWDSDSHELFL